MTETYQNFTSPPPRRPAELEVSQIFAAYSWAELGMRHTLKFWHQLFWDCSGAITFGRFKSPTLLEILNSDLMYLFKAQFGRQSEDLSPHKDSFITYEIKIKFMFSFYWNAVCTKNIKLNAECVGEGTKSRNIYYFVVKDLFHFESAFVTKMFVDFVYKKGWHITIPNLHSTMQAKLA